MKATVAAEVKADLINKFYNAGYVGLAAALTDPSEDSNELPQAPTQTATPTPDMLVNPNSKEQSDSTTPTPAITPTRLIETSIADYYNGAILPMLMQSAALTRTDRFVNTATHLLRINGSMWMLFLKMTVHWSGRPVLKCVIPEISANIQEPKVLRLTGQIILSCRDKKPGSQYLLTGVRILAGRPSFSSCTTRIPAALLKADRDLSLTTLTKYARFYL